MTLADQTATADPATADPTAATAILAVPASRGTCPFDPPPAYERAREEEPAAPVRLWDGSITWMLTRHQDIRAVLGDRRFSADANRPGFPFLSAGRRALATMNASFIRMDDPEHARLRRMLTGDFIVKRAEALRPRIRAIAEDLLAAMTQGRSGERAGHADLVREFALPLPSLVICLLLGVPYEDHAYFQQRSSTILSNTAGLDEVRTARADLNAYIKQLTEAKRRRDEDDDILSRLIRHDDLTDDEIAAMGMLLLVAGHETTANMTALSVLALLRDPVQLGRLRADPTLIRGAVEELLRYLTIVHTGVARVATEDVEIAGRTIRAGEGVLCMINAANRDERVFPGAGVLDVGRDARRHLAFGFGVHQCLGQPLARTELQVALEVLLEGLPNLGLAVPFEEIPFRHDMLVYGVRSLPVAW
ncbi:cytochrome P450 [Catenulispora subtropica]|uniref:Cytochrome P450 n=1 Tax=Catenulispora subtropica TaxID=450798 RepID=A0ABP5E4L0_9ACTN